MSMQPGIFKSNKFHATMSALIGQRKPSNALTVYRDWANWPAAVTGETLTINACQCIIIGDQVYINFNLQFNLAQNFAGGTFTITGLPITPLTTSADNVIAVHDNTSGDDFPFVMSFNANNTITLTPVDPGSTVMSAGNVCAIFSQGVYTANYLP